MRLKLTADTDDPSGTSLTTESGEPFYVSGVRFEQNHGQRGFLAVALACEQRQGISLAKGGDKVQVTGSPIIMCLNPATKEMARVSKITFSDGTELTGDLDVTKEPRFSPEGEHHMFDKVEGRYWIREPQRA